MDMSSKHVIKGRDGEEGTEMVLVTSSPESPVSDIFTYVRKNIMMLDF